MNQAQYSYLLEAMFALNRMIQSEQSYPHGDCETVAPTFNICYGCQKHGFCVARQDFNEAMSSLDVKAGG